MSGATPPAGPTGPDAAPGDPEFSKELANAHAQLIAKQVQEGRRKFYNQLEDHVLDYMHNNPVHIEGCLNTCVKLFGNVVNNPEDQKFRKIKATSNTLKNTVMLVKGGEELLLYGGWVPRVVDMEKYWLFDAEADSVRFGVLKEALHLCEKALATVHEKAEKKRKEKEEKLTRENAEKERIRLAIEEDKAERKLRQELTAAAPVLVGAAAATAGGGNQGSAGKPGGE
ncbi:hypothetical protein HYH03_009770 [Edaphochlamys debaryana]|uniref:PUB domain-containing protein n=1 Tax=Edaphochlamys debaryana TaxID=47281 RepID=A0A836BWU2_9CHLO|nr:hypothetical protein HYH03_009770 [Edaphochlamys debaryana]|eukprot:KAG2492041.1 hypothetical protein HYH03_009770 [Edaphochlamys debaryana]